MQLHEHHLSGTRHLWHPGRGQGLLRQGSQGPDRSRGGHARRHHPLTVVLGSGRRSRTGAGPIHARAAHHAGGRLHHRAGAAGGPVPADHRVHAAELLSGGERLPVADGARRADRRRHVQRRTAGHRRLRHRHHHRQIQAGSHVLGGQPRAERHAGRHPRRHGVRRHLRQRQGRVDHLRVRGRGLPDQAAQPSHAVGV